MVVTEAENGTLGIERARFDRPRLILLDLNMPGLNGFEVLDELKSHAETEDIPIVVYTSRNLSAPERELTVAELRAEVIRLGPWHVDFAITPEISTRAFLDAPALPPSGRLVGGPVYPGRSAFLETDLHDAVVQA